MYSGSEDTTLNILIMGGNGGIGRALVEDCLERYPHAQIVATWHRHKPVLACDNLQWYQVDVCSEQDIKQLAQQFQQLDLLINTVGLLHDEQHGPEKSIARFEASWLQRSMEVNVAPSLMLARYFQPLLKKSARSCFAVISARVGSIEDNRLGGWISYRSSKAALNMAMKTLSIEWQRAVPGCCVTVLHPGTTDTQLSQPFQRNVQEGQLFDPAKTAGLLLDVIAGLNPEDSGRFYAYDGSLIPW
ncbi:SDR family oxidoreductase [Spongorhabdus nitratireducens]